MALCIGVELSDDLIAAYNLETKSMLALPAVISKDKKEDIWRIGEDAYRSALSGNGVLADNLLALLKKKGTRTIQRKTYRAETLISKLLFAVLSQLLGAGHVSEIDFLTVAVRKADADIFAGVLSAAEALGIPEEKLQVTSFEEAFVHYILAQNRELSFNMVGLFDLRAESLAFYNLKLQRGTGKKCALASGGELEEKFRIGILGAQEGTELADRIMLDAAQKCMGSDVYSSVLLTGAGFERTDWAGRFLSFVSRKRKVMYEGCLFAIGAAVCSGKRARGEEDEYLVFCDTRLMAEISVKVEIRGKSSKLILLPAGAAWYSLEAYAELLPQRQNFIDIDIRPADRAKPEKTLRMELGSFPKRPDGCSRFLLRVRSPGPDRLCVSLKDLGFGEFFETSRLVTEKEVSF